MFTQDLRGAVRAWRHAPATLVAAILCLAIGIGLYTTFYSVVNAAFVRPLPFLEPDRLIVIAEIRYRSSEAIGTGASFLDLRDWQADVRAVSAMAAVQTRTVTLADTGQGSRDAGRYTAGAISASLFPMIGVAPLLGRGISAEDDRPGAARAVVLSHTLWQQRFSGDAGILGRTLAVDGQPHAVVGVMPPEFEFPATTKLWMALEPEADRTERQARTLQVYARLRPDATIERARAEFQDAARRLELAYPDTNEGWGVRVQGLAESLLPGHARLTILALMGAATLVLATACANVANLLLVRAAARRREFALRLALGAGRLRIVRQLVVESVALALLSVPPGLAIARLCIHLIETVAIPRDQVAYYLRLSIDVTVAAQAIAVAVATGVFFGSIPAVQTVRTDLVGTLKEGGRGAAGGQSRLGGWLVVLEVALSAVLLVGGVLFVRSVLNLQQAGIGFDPAPLLTVRVHMVGAAYDTEAERVLRTEAILDRFARVAGIRAAAASPLVPLRSGPRSEVTLDGRVVDRARQPMVALSAVTPNFFDTLGVPLRRGRTVTRAEDQARAELAVVNQAMADLCWPNADPIGRRFQVGARAGEWFTVIGVVADIRNATQNEGALTIPSAYVPLRHDASRDMGLTIRAAGSPAAIVTDVRGAIQDVDASLPIVEVETMEMHRQRSLWPDRVFGWMFALFGLIALLLAAIGVYGVLSYAVAQRTQELAVRMALGAARTDIVYLVLWRGLRLVFAGLIGGAVGAVWVGFAVRSLLYRVSPTDPVSLAVVALFLTGVAGAACYLPARRATTVQPIDAMRKP